MHPEHKSIAGYFGADKAGRRSDRLRLEAADRERRPAAFLLPNEVRGSLASYLWIHLREGLGAATANPSLLFVLKWKLLHHHGQYDALRAGGD
jgi:hypothetical protein